MCVCCGNGKMLTCTLVNPKNQDVYMWGTSNTRGPSAMFAKHASWDRCDNNEHFHITLFAFRTLRKHAENVRCVPLESVTVRVTASTEKTKTFKFANKVELVLTLEHASLGLEDVQDALMKSQEDRASKCYTYMSEFFDTHNITTKNPEKRYLSSAMRESDWVTRNGASYEKMPALSGWPQMSRLSFNVAEYWPRAVICACNLLGANVDAILANRMSNHKQILDVLLVVTLTAFAGSYPLEPELKDSRTLGSLTMMTNRDCEDMALTTCAVFHWMKSSAHTVFPGEGSAARMAKRLRDHLHTFADAGCLTCVANGSVAVPGKKQGGKPCGHVLAVLCRHTGENCLHDALPIESTRPSSPYCQTIASYTCTPQGTKAFARTQQYAYKNYKEGIKAVKPLQFVQYHTCIMLQFKDRTGICTISDGKKTRLGGGLKEMMKPTKPYRTRVVYFNVPKDAAYDPLVAALAHHPNYNIIDKAIKAHGWDETKLGIVNPQEMIQLKDFEFCTDPRKAQEKGPMAITSCVAYSFKSPTYIDAIYHR